ncbi:hypothetical protein KAS41_01905 [Candidatus Parcubacteria bacterium]|nr:hypothetical protein [Candidatus Parcubacteria bacterium]
MPAKNTQNDFQKQAQEIVKKSHNKKVYFAIAAVFTAIAIGLFIGIAVIVNNYEYLRNNKNAIINKIPNQIIQKEISAIEISADKKEVLNSETKEVIFTIEEANKYLKDSSMEYAGNCLTDASLRTPAPDKIVFSTGCLFKDTEKAWIGIYNIPYKYKTDLEQSPGIYFLTSGSGRNFIWSDNGYYITYEVASKLNGMMETKKIDIYGKIIKTKIDTANWQIYRNEEFGFEMKYPENFKVEQPVSDVFIIYASSENKKKYLQIQWMTTAPPFTFKSNGERIGHTGYSPNGAEYVGEKVIGNKESIKYYTNDPFYKEENDLPFTRYVIRFGNKEWIYMEYHGEKDVSDFFDQILSTFKFID